MYILCVVCNVPDAVHRIRIINSFLTGSREDSCLDFRFIEVRQERKKFKDNILRVQLSCFL